MALRRHRERGEENPPPSSSSSLASPLDERRVPPLVHGLHGSGGAGAPPRLDLPLCSLLFRVPEIWPFTVSSIPKIRNSDCAEIFTRFFSINYLSCARRRALTDVRGGHKTPGRAWALWRTLLGCGHYGNPFALIPPPKNNLYSKIILRKFLSRFDFV